MEKPRIAPNDPVAEGAHTRARRIRKDACPYPLNSPERAAWMEGYDGRPRDYGADRPQTSA
ncbi:hypothetical protein [Methylobacterium nigriterrae]|uniref:hypothetical protein n=1 Tax=Methylobacterium nigriterrae TaxID=3127512 RepID=UPI003013BDC0